MSSLKLTKDEVDHITLCMDMMLILLDDHGYQWNDAQMDSIEKVYSILGEDEIPKLKLIKK
jgi:hypothetical protein